MTDPFWRAADPAELDEIALQMLSYCAKDRKFALYGNLGAGKTALIKACCRSLGLSNKELSSPSFAIAHEYGPKPVVFHLDLYRLKTVDELKGIGLEQYLDGPEYCFIEWPEIAESWLDSSVIRINIDLDAEGARLIRLQKLVPLNNG